MRHSIKYKPVAPPPPEIYEVVLYLSPRELEVIKACVDSSTEDRLRRHGVNHTEAVELVRSLRDAFAASR